MVVGGTGEGGFSYTGMGNNGLKYGAAIPIQATATATAFAEAATYQAAVAAVATLAAGALTSDVSRVSVAGGGSADTTHSVRRERCRENLPEIIWGDSSCASCDDVSAVNNINIYIPAARLPATLEVVAAALTASTPAALRPVSLPGPGWASQRRVAHRGLAQILFLARFHWVS